MSIEAINFLAPSQEINIANADQAVKPGNFSDWLEGHVKELNGKLIESDKQIQRLALGETDNLHQVMITLEEAKVSFQLVMQVRNRLLEAYQDILRMQI